MNKFFLLLIPTLLLTACTFNQTSHKISFDEATEEAKLFAPFLISTPMFERDFAMNPKKDEILYTISNYQQTSRSIVHLDKKSGSWTENQIVPFSGQYNDIEAFFSPDGKSVFFASDRPLNESDSTSDFNIWKVNWTNGNWGEPIALDTIINSEADEYYPSVSSNGNLYFTSSRASGQGLEDIFVCKWENQNYQHPTPLDSAINSPGYEFNAFINPSEDLLIFSSFGRPDGYGGGDLYYAKKNQAGNWMPAQNMGQGVNSSSLDYCPFYDEELSTLFFSSNRYEDLQGKQKSMEDYISNSISILNGAGNIYWIKQTLN